MLKSELGFKTRQYIMLIRIEQKSQPIFVLIRELYLHS
jgi:hypothetical protein